MPKSTTTKKSVKRKIGANIANAYVIATFNNTIVTLVTQAGETIAWSSAGKCGFKGSRKSTPHVAQLVALDALNGAPSVERIDSVYCKGAGPGRDSAIRALASKCQVLKLTDKTGVPFNGCRPPKKRRV